MRNIRKVSTPNFNERAGGVAPSILILHYTGTTTAIEAENVYTNLRPDAAAGPVSPHYMIDRDGSVVQFVEEDKRAWHAGRSWWEGDEDINSHSLGIELVNPGHERGYLDFTAEQMESLAELTLDIMKRHDIPPHRVLGHTDIAPGRKPDPGEKLDWSRLAGQGIGLWPQPARADYDMAEVLFGDAQALRQGFTDYGYDPRLDDAVILSAFQMHFQPVLHAENRAGAADKHTAAILHWLLNAKNSYGTV